MGNSLPPAPIGQEEADAVLDGKVSLRGIADYILDGSATQILVLAGAGISVSAGIPDFRSPKTGLYSNLQRYGLPYPEAVFDIDYFKENPKPFFELARELFPGKVKPTIAHCFIALLQQKNLLRRCYTQNIDTLERSAGISEDKLVEAHGSFATAACVECKEDYDPSYVKEHIDSDRIPKCSNCEDGIVKPNIVFFGEDLPVRFFRCINEDVVETDLVIVMGTSLSVQPVAGLVNEVDAGIPRLLINKELVGMRDHTGHGFRFNAEDNYRDVACLEECDTAVMALCELLGWTDEMEELVEQIRGEKPVIPDPSTVVELAQKEWREVVSATSTRLAPLQPPCFLSRGKVEQDGPPAAGKQKTLAPDSELKYRLEVELHGGTEQIRAGDVLKVHITPRKDQPAFVAQDYLMIVPAGSTEIPKDPPSLNFLGLMLGTPSVCVPRNLSQVEVWFITAATNRPQARMGPFDVHAGRVPDDAQKAAQAIAAAVASSVGLPPQADNAEEASETADGGRVGRGGGGGEGGTGGRGGGAAASTAEKVTSPGNGARASGAVSGGESGTRASAEAQTKQADEQQQQQEDEEEERRVDELSGALKDLRVADAAAAEVQRNTAES